MKTILTAMMVLALALNMSLEVKASEIYDRSYQGPMNMYGQPALIIPPNQAGQNSSPSGSQGLLPMAVDGLSQAGGYLWSYMPAPVRGAQSPYAVPPGSGQVTTSFVPGTR
ncbi:MAG: hypothetical protein V1897_14125 [Pseudomonadota bacterium]